MGGIYKESLQFSTQEFGWPNLACHKLLDSETLVATESGLTTILIVE